MMNVAPAASDSFGQEVRAGGIDGLIKSLKDKNKQLETTVQAKK